MAKRKKVNAVRVKAAAYATAQKQLADAVNAEWPVGTPVWAKMSRGLMAGVVSAGAWGSWPEYVKVRSDNSGKVHSKHYSDLLRM